MEAMETETETAEEEQDEWWRWPFFPSADTPVLDAAAAPGHHPKHRQGFSSDLTPLPSDRESRNTPIVDRRPPTGCPNLLVRHDDRYLLFRDSTLVARFASLDDYQTYHTTQQQKQQEEEEEDKDKENKENKEEGEDAGGGGTVAPRKKRCPVLYVEPETDLQGRRQYRRRDAHQKKRDRGTVRGLSAAFWDWQHLGSVPTDRPLVSALGGDTAAPPSSAATKKPKLAAFNENAMDSWLRSDLVKSAAEARDAMGAISDNAMDPHWGGVRWTQQVIDSGKYDSHTLFRPAAASTASASATAGEGITIGDAGARPGGGGTRFTLQQSASTKSDAHAFPMTK